DPLGTLIFAPALMSIRITSRSQPLLAASVMAVLPFLSDALMSAPRSSSIFVIDLVSGAVGRTPGEHASLEKYITRSGGPMSATLADGDMPASRNARTSSGSTFERAW